MPLPTETAPTPTLFVDLDGTLIDGDLLHESLAGAVRQDLGVLFRIPFWVARGRVELKLRLAELDSVEVETLPYRQDVLGFLREERLTGRRIVLATASHRALAEKVAAHLKCFDAVIATDGENVKGLTKLKLIRRHLSEQGEGESFEYMGDSRADEPIFGASVGYFVVGSRKFGGIEAVQRRRFDSGRRLGSKVAGVLKLIRPHQWAKNALIFVPVLAGQRILDLATVGSATLAVVVFSLLASSVYVFNDLLDLSSDRRHHRKRLRPLASGRVSIVEGVVLGMGLLVVAAGLGVATLPAVFVAWAGVYFVVSTLYSVVLKRKLLVDVLCLAALYTLRILAGGAATGIVVSHWLLAFSMFMFLSLAFVKRYTELAMALEGAKGRVLDSRGVKASGRGYFEVDLDLIRSVGPTAGYLAVLVLALFVSSPEVATNYRTPTYLYGLCPVVLYWVTRVWFLAQRRELHDDPVVFALGDRHSYVVALLCVAILLVAKFL